MKRLLAAILALGLLTGIALANDSFMYIEMTKVTNGSYEYKLPAIEWSLTKTPFLLDLELSEIYTAPRSNIGQLNHGCINLNPNFGFQNGNYFATVSLGLRYYIGGNDWGIPEGIELYNTIRAGIKF